MIPEKYYYPQWKLDQIDKRCSEFLEEHKDEEEIIRSCSLRTRNYRGQGQQVEIRKDEVSNTITTVNKDYIIFHKKDSGFRIRNTTPREAARLQGFPDDYKIVVSDSQAYQQIANAVTVSVSNVLANAIKEFLQGGQSL